MSTHKPPYAGPPLAEIYFYLTEGCNLRCRHCWIMTEHEAATASKPKALLDVQLFEHIVEQARPLGLKAVKLTGGEPFLHPQVHRMLEIIRDAGLNLVVETNGVLVTPALAAQVASSRKSAVSVSLDGADPETHEWVRQVPGAFQGALAGIRHQVQAGIRPQIIFTLMRKNRDQVEEVVRLARELGASSVKLNILQPSPRGDSMRDHGDTLSVPEVLELCQWVERELAPAVNFPIFTGYPPAFSPLKLVVSASVCSHCGILGVLGVLANGSYALCGIGSHIPELVFGHASRNSLMEVWQHHPVLQEIREGLPGRLEGICQDCFIKGKCLGFCLAQNYYVSRNLWAPYWLCQQAEAAGLFPESRRRPGRGHLREDPAGVWEKGLHCQP